MHCISILYTNIIVIWEPKYLKRYIFNISHQGILKNETIDDYVDNLENECLLFLTIIPIDIKSNE